MYPVPGRLSSSASSSVASSAGGGARLALLSPCSLTGRLATPGSHQHRYRLPAPAGFVLRQDAFRHMKGLVGGRCGAADGHAFICAVLSLSWPCPASVEPHWALPSQVESSAESSGRVEPSSRVEPSRAESNRVEPSLRSGRVVPMGPGSRRISPGAFVCGEADRRRPTRQWLSQACAPDVSEPLVRPFRAGRAV